MTVHDIDGMACATCFYWNRIGGNPAEYSGPERRATKRQVVGSCSRFPPALMLPNGEPSYVFTFDTWCCGEWSTDQEPPQSLGLAEIA